MRTIGCYCPGDRFPAVSITGARCELDCPHCAGRPLSNMIEAETPGRLIEVAGALEDEGALGFLLSGGCDADGCLPLAKFLGAIESIKATTRLKINAHIGLPRKDAVEAIVASGIDAFSITYPISQGIAGDYFGVEDVLGRYAETIKGLESQGATRVIPHVLLGLGGADEEARALQSLGEQNPSSLVVIAFTPLAGTPLERRPPTADSRIVSFIECARRILPGTKLVLGCMRPRGRIQMEQYLAEGFLDGIVMPNGSAMRSLAGKVAIERREGCCALYL